MNGLLQHVTLAKKLKKEKVQMDIICFGPHEENTEVLAPINETLNGK